VPATSRAEQHFSTPGRSSPKERPDAFPPPSPRMTMLSAIIVYTIGARPQLEGTALKLDLQRVQDEGEKWIYQLHLDLQRKMSW
jgi:hypothetical protein